MREWVLFIAKWALFSDMAKAWYIRLYDNNVCFVIYQHPYLDFHSATSLKQPSAVRHVVAFDTDTLFRVLANQSLLFLLNAVCSAEKQQIAKFMSLWFDPTGFELTISRTLGEYIFRSYSII